MAAAVAAMSIPIHAAGPSTAPGQNKIQCFDGASDADIYQGTCTLNSSGAKGSATLALTSGDPAGDYAGVYTLDSALYNSLAADLTQLSYHYQGTIAAQPGNLSYNIPIDTNGDTLTEFFLFVDAYYCPGKAGVVDIVNDANCVMWEGGAVPRANWAAFLAANPGARIANDNYAFIVSERTGAEPSAIWMVNDVKFGKAGKKK